MTPDEFQRADAIVRAALGAEAHSEYRRAAIHQWTELLPRATAHRLLHDLLSWSAERLEESTDPLVKAAYTHVHSPLLTWAHHQRKRLDLTLDAEEARKPTKAKVPRRPRSPKATGDDQHSLFV